MVHVSLRKEERIRIRADVGSCWRACCTDSRKGRPSEGRRVVMVMMDVARRRTEN